MNATQKRILAGMLALTMAVFEGTPNAMADNAKQKKRHAKKNEQPPKGKAVRVRGIVRQIDVTENGKTRKAYAIEITDDGGAKGAKGKTIPLFSGTPGQLKTLLDKEVMIGGVLMENNSELCIISIAAVPDAAPEPKK